MAMFSHDFISSMIQKNCFKSKHDFIYKISGFLREVSRREQKPRRKWTLSEFKDIRLHSTLNSFSFSALDRDELISIKKKFLICVFVLPYLEYCLTKQQKSVIVKHVLKILTNFDKALMLQTFAHYHIYGIC